jgi:hypothetical protein
MSVRSGQAITVCFETASPTTLAAADADSTPTGTLVVNGTDNVAGVVVTNKSTGDYKAAVTLPTLAIGDVVELRINATVGGVVGKATVWRDSKDVLLDASGKTAESDKTGYALTAGERTTLAGVLEAAILNEGDATALLAAIAAKVETFLINEGDATATLAAIATAVRTNLAAELARVLLALPAFAPGVASGLPTLVGGLPGDGLTLGQVAVAAPSSIATIAESVRDVDNTTSVSGTLGGDVKDAASGADPGAPWEESAAGHNTTGTMGAKMNSAASAGDPWTTPLPGSYGSGTAGAMLSGIKAKTDLITLTGLLVTNGSTPVITVAAQKSGGTLGSVNAGSTYQVNVYAQLPTGSNTTPTTLRYRIDDVETGTEVLDWTSSTPGNPTALVIAATDNRIVDTARNSEKHALTMEATYSDGSTATGEWFLFVKKMPFGA